MKKTRIEGNPKQNVGKYIEFLQKYFIYFMLYSVIGWCYEVFLEVVIYRWGFSNRGVLFGPYCVVYGFGALLLLLTLSRLKEHKYKIGPVNLTPVFVFIGIVVITTLVELCASYLMEWQSGAWQWDYTRFAFNYQGRIALNPSLRFGLGGMLFLYVLQPLFEKLIHWLSGKKLTFVTAIWAVLLVIDIVWTFVF